ncbi:MAG: amino acid permease [Cyanobacteriota/Melainabacteria group bacterium]
MSSGSIVSELFRCVPAVQKIEGDDTPRHLGWLMLTGLGIGATIGAGIFAMPGIIAGKAGPGGVLSFLITGLVILIVAICYEKFSCRMPQGVSAYSYVYHSMGELVAWIVAFGLFMEYSFGASAVAIAWSVYLDTAVGLNLPPELMGPKVDATGYHFGVNVVAIGVVSLITAILIFGGVSKSAKLNFMLVILKMVLLMVFLLWNCPCQFGKLTPFMPMGWDGVLKGAAVAVFPYVGFDALYTFARESKSQKDTRIGTYLTVGVVALLYVAVMAVATGLAPCFIDGTPNPLFVGSEAAAPLAKLLVSVGETWTAQFIAIGAVLGIFNVLLVLCMGGPRIFRNMAEDGLLPKIFSKSSKGNPTFGILLNGVLVAAIAGFMDFGDIADMMVLGTLVAFIFVCIGAVKLKLLNPILPVIGALGCIILAFHLNVAVLQAYAITCPFGLLIYGFYGYRNSRLRKSE